MEGAASAGPERFCSAGRDVIAQAFLPKARINVLNRLTGADLDRLVTNGLGEVALGIESGSDRILAATDKRIGAETTERVARRLVAHGIGVKGCFILGFPGETRSDLDATVRHIRNRRNRDRRSHSGPPGPKKGSHQCHRAAAAHRAGAAPAPRTGCRTVFPDRPCNPFPLPGVLSGNG
ncbi:radical SAM protein [Streptomyces sp. NPDC038707]|uniref:tRNA-2-methylthio-N(6)-dimethylallyladenosine synthase n=1 Tax=Streptomyces achromogenes subsp. streptozoticus TaxID=285532 RepID=A0A411MR64_STRC2|nr:tRNA-2-methylthio-N(6)-dimethylallyladenosine synthase [Streptomyces achromogenes subsp. streptozoticus]